jgi:hypothetical protein
MCVVKGKTRLRLVIELAAVAFQCFTGHPVSLLRDVVTKLIARNRSRLTPFGDSVDLNCSQRTADVPRPSRSH